MKMNELNQEHTSLGDNVGQHKQTNEHSAPSGVSGVQGNVTVKGDLIVNHNLISSQNKRFKLSIEEHEITPEQALEYVELIRAAVKKRQNTDNCSITLEFTVQSSIEFILDGSQEDLQCLAALYKSRELQTLLNELKPENIHEIVVKKAEFIEDAQIIAKAQLIKAIRDEKVDKKNLQKADLIRANLIRADLSWANLSEAKLRRANLSEAKLRRANLNKANLSEANLSEANLSEAFLSEAFLSEAFLSGANLSGANLSGANLSGANLIRANLIRANLIRANLSGADVENAIFTDAKGINPEEKQDLIRRGAIFNDYQEEKSGVLIHR